MGLRGYIYGHTKAGFVDYSGENKTNLSSQMGTSLNADGTKLYTTRHNAPDSIAQYSLSTAWNISTATFINASLTINQEGENEPKGHFISPDGLKMFVCGYSSSKLLKYTLSTAWNVNSASYNGFISLGYQPHGVYFSPDGLLMFISNFSNIRKYILTTAWDISTASLSQTKSITAYPSNDLFITEDGLFIFLFSTATSTVSKHYLSSPFDISTFVKTETINLSSIIPVGNFSSINFKPDGLKMFISIYQFSIYAFDLEKPFNIKGALI